jgi:hypothetical protein
MRLLATELTELERQYLHKRIAEEHVQLERLEKSQPAQQTEVRGAAGALEKRTGGQSHSIGLDCPALPTRPACSSSS